jgi:CBS domain-containing protein
MRIRDVMTEEPKFCMADDSVIDAACIMRDEHVGVVPVIESEESRRVVGMVTDRDLCLGVIAEGQDPAHVRVDQCMTSKVVCCVREDAVEDVTDLMQANQIRRVPVIDDDGQLVGIVSLADLVGRARLRSAETIETLKSVSTPTEEASKPRAESRKAA